MGALISLVLSTPKARKLTAIAIGVLLILTVLGVAYHQIRQGAFQEAEHQMLQQSLKAERERKRDETFLQDLDDYQLCREYLRSRSVSDSECERLRGVHRQQP
jgi:uncharacterized protein HemX